MSSGDVIDLCSDKEDEFNVNSPAKKPKLNNDHEKENNVLLHNEETKNANNKVTISFTNNNNKHSSLEATNKGNTINSPDTIAEEDVKKDKQFEHENSKLEAESEENLLMIWRTEPLDAPQDTPDNFDNDSFHSEQILEKRNNGGYNVSPDSLTLKLSSDQSDNDIESAQNDNIGTSQLPISFALPTQFESFLKECERSIKSPKLNNKLKSVRTAAKHSSVYVQSEEFLTDLANFKKNRSAENKDLSYVLVDLYKRLKEKENSEEIEEKRYDEKLAMLNSKLEQIKAKIAKLGDEEVDFEEEENSSYCKYLKYCERADMIVKKIAQIGKYNPYAGIAYFARLDFSKSNIQEFNIAINKKYRNREQHTFPTYYEVDKLLRKCIKKHNLTLKENDIKQEVKFCFEELGKLLKKRRQKDLESVHSTYLPSFTDPAKSDAQLEEKLRKNKREASKALTEVLQKYSRMQDTGIDPDLSDDSDDSKHSSAEESGSD